jgi:hypothetical protein
LLSVAVAAVGTVLRLFLAVVVAAVVMCCKPSISMLVHIL